jgi:hypothetical protein
LDALSSFNYIPRLHGVDALEGRLCPLEGISPPVPAAARHLPVPRAQLVGSSMLRFASTQIDNRAVSMCGTSTRLGSPRGNANLLAFAGNFNDALDLLLIDLTCSSYLHRSWHFRSSSQTAFGPHNDSGEGTPHMQTASSSRAERGRNNRGNGAGFQAVDPFLVLTRKSSYTSINFHYLQAVPTHERFVECSFIHPSSTSKQRPEAISGFVPCLFVLVNERY